ncbi:uncharacterized protein L201_005314 [Kwoniella dendrophila CBS 6074]|uniref:Uncharacterized protein n=1 Tax=Kwoniella dendrophila CBS 6074 TaxID=1295534 RepID=A0AAX4JYT0_9TREE
MIDIPLRHIRKLLKQKDQSTLHSTSSTVQTDSPLRMGSTGSYTCKTSGFSQNDQNKVSNPNQTLPEILGGVNVLTPKEWQSKSLYSLAEGPSNTGRHPKLFGGRVFEVNRCGGRGRFHFSDLGARDYGGHHKSTSQFDKTLGGLGKPLNLPNNQNSKENERVEFDDLTKMNVMGREEFTNYISYYTKTSRKIPSGCGLKNVIFNGEKLVFHHADGQVSMLDFT